MFEVLMNGVGDAFSVQHWGTHFLIRKGSFVLAVDCPDSFRRALHTNAFAHDGQTLDAQDLDAMILTHLHGDHVNGLEMTACYLAMAHDTRLPLYTSPQTAALLWPRLYPSLHVLWDGEAFHEQTLDTFLEVHEVDWHQPFEVGPFTITTYPTRHHLRATALRVVDEEGAMLGYSCDTAYDPELIAWLRQADLIIHESSMGAAHTPLTALMDLPEAVRQKMLVAHYPDAMIGADLDVLRLAEEGAIYPVEETTASA